MIKKKIKYKDKYILILSKSDIKKSQYTRMLIIGICGWGCMRRELLGSPFIAPIPYAPPSLPFYVGRETMSAEKLGQSIGRSVYEISEREKGGLKTPTRKLWTWFKFGPFQLTMDSISSFLYGKCIESEIHQLILMSCWTSASLSDVWLMT